MTGVHYCRHDRA